MADALPTLLLRWLKVPPPPALDRPGLRVFRAAPGFLHYRLCLWAVRQLGVALGLVAGWVFFDRFVLPREIEQFLWLDLARWLEVLAWTGFILQLPFGFFVARLDCSMRWYILSDGSLRIREGVVTVQEKTMTFANIQQVSIRQNPLQRLLGIADVKVESAGGGASPSDSGEYSVKEGLHEAHFRGVANAEEIREVMLARVRMHQDAGLGEAAAREAPRPPVMPATLEAARELLGEVRALRQALPPRSG